MGVLVEAGLVPLCPCLADLGRPRSVVCPIRSHVRPGTRCSRGRRWCAVSRQPAAGVPVQAGSQLRDLQLSPHPSRPCLADGGSGKAGAWIGAGVSQGGEQKAVGASGMAWTLCPSSVPGHRPLHVRATCDSRG